MKKFLRFPTGLVAGLAAGTVISLFSSGCVNDGSRYARGSGNYRTGQAQTVVTYQDDYDYYPAYEVYYARNRHEYVYRDGSSWVRRPAPRGVTVDLLLSTPSVRLDFHDEPEHHNDSVVKTYPRNWQPAGKARTNDNSRRNDEKHDKKDNDNRGGN